jgi:hypothetical protein
MVPFIVQFIVMSLDEYYFHVKRGLPLWERIGHPIDTLTVLACCLFVYCVPYSATALKWYVGLAIFSCLMVTKDEFIHKHHCPAAEHWLHAILFINHPILLTCVGYIWKKPSLLLTAFLGLQILLVSLFFLYQVIYWNVWKRKTE